jgi:membrane-associated phospholipid phosphatase
LRLTDIHVPYYPQLADPVLSRLPTLNIDEVGEIGLALFLAVFLFHHFRRQPERTPLLFVSIGMLFAARGVFLWLMPIGAPPGAPADALQVYPYSDHSYFPSGHVGFISLCAWLCRERGWRWFFLTVALVFGLGTMLAKAHYTADLLGAFLLSHAVATLALQASARMSMSTARQVSRPDPMRQDVVSASGPAPAEPFEGAEHRASSSSETPSRR